MRSVKEIKFFNHSSIIRSFNENKFNLIVTPRQWGLTTLLINYINQIPNDKTILFGVWNLNMIIRCGRKITHPNCKIQTISEAKLIGRSFDYIICDNFFDREWISKLVLISPVLNTDGKLILADSGRGLDRRIMIEYFRNYNKIIKTN